MRTLQKEKMCMQVTHMETKPSLFNTKDYIMLLITLGGVVVSITAWGYSLKGSIDLNKQATEQLVQAQKEANENVKSLAVNQSKSEKDIVGLQKDVDTLQKKTLSYNTGSRVFPDESIASKNEKIDVNRNPRNE